MRLINNVLNSGVRLITRVYGTTRNMLSEACSFLPLDGGSQAHVHCTHGKWQNGVRTTTNVVMPPSAYKLESSGCYTEAYEPARFGIFPWAGLGTCRNSSRVPLVWYWYPEFNLYPARILALSMGWMFLPFFATSSRSQIPFFAATCRYAGVMGIIKATAARHGN